MDDYSLTYTVKIDDKYVFLRDVLKFEMRISHSLLNKLKTQNKIMVNGQVTLANYKLKPGDLVTVDLSLPERSDIIPEDLPLEIIYEDTDFLVINKQPGLSIHPSKGTAGGTLANAVTYYWQQKGVSAVFRPINRLDRDTSGLVLIGQSQYAHQAIFQQQKQGTVNRVYQAIVEGVMPEDSGCIDLPIALKDPDLRERIIDPAGKPALTNYRVIKRYPGYTHLALTLGTGRTHQIRVHLSHIGYPILGDDLYGHPSPLIGRQALHAGDLSFTHPRSGEPLHFIAPLPEDMRELIDALNK
ncbi:MAG: RluA family pseudouridine synthase [Chitinophagales bacterium]